MATKKYSVTPRRYPCSFGVNHAHRKQEAPGWQHLRRELEEQKAKWKQLALNDTLVWAQPSLPDEEGVQTRISTRTRPTIELILAQDVVQKSARLSRVQLLNGEVIELYEHKRSFEAAKAIHRNLVRVPRYAVGKESIKVPIWLQQYVYGAYALGIVRAGDIFWSDSEEPSGLTWHFDEGVFIPELERSKPIGNREYDNYESFD